MTPFHEILARYRAPIDTVLAESLSAFGPKTLLRDAIEYALKNGGKRFRPAIVYLVGEALGKGHDLTDSALAVEYFHTASLIVDDLPCMDDDAERRGKPALHRAFSESTALLASYVLLTAGYDRIRLNGETLGMEPLIPLAIENASYNAGIFGATGGQHLDLFPGKLNEAVVLDVMDKKTGTFFELAFVLGWLYGGGARAQLDLVKKTARHFGLAFQISDDFLDYEEDQSEGRVNLPAVVGRKRATHILQQELGELGGALKKLRLDTPELLALVALIEERAAQTSTSSFS